MKHKNYDYIVAWANGEEVEYRMHMKDPKVELWVPLSKGLAYLFEEDTYTFRMRPKKEVSVGYKVFLHKTSDGIYPALVWEDGAYDPSKHDPLLLAGYTLNGNTTKWRWSDGSETETSYPGFYERSGGVAGRMTGAPPQPSGA